MSDYFLIAKIISVHNKNGFLRAEIFSDFPERFENLKYVFLDFWGDKKLFVVEDCQKLKDKILFKFKNFKTERELNALAGREVFIEESNTVALPENNYFIHDLIGSKVLKNGEVIGTVNDVIKTPANDVLIITDDFGNETLIPFVNAFIENIDAAGKIIKLKDEVDLNPDDED